jgi:hypothetical protein
MSQGGSLYQRIHIAVYEALTPMQKEKPDLSSIKVPKPGEKREEARPYAR